MKTNIETTNEPALTAPMSLLDALRHESETRADRICALTEAAILMLDSSESYEPKVTAARDILAVLLDLAGALSLSLDATSVELRIEGAQDGHR